MFTFAAEKDVDRFEQLATTIKNAKQYTPLFIHLAGIRRVTAHLPFIFFLLNNSY